MSPSPDQPVSPPEFSADVDPFTAPVGRDFVVQQHYATRLHHDFRLEMISEAGPVLVSWAVPKGLPVEKGERHLAIHVEDHSMRHATFSGTIPAGEYGGGEVRIFDYGVYEMIGRDKDRITFRLEGERLAGVWHLIHTGPKDGKDQWLAVLSEDDRPPAEDRPPLDPMLATLAGEPFDNSEWSFEPKWDGIRALAVCNDGTRLISRNDHDITVAYPELHKLHEQVVALEAILDGEIVAFAEGAPSFQHLQQRMHLRDARQIEDMVSRIPVAYMIFDLLYVDGKDLTRRSLQERRKTLAEAIVPTENVQISPVTIRDGIALFEAAKVQGLEGIMAKRMASVYRPGARSRDWLKVKVTFDADVVVVGWTEGAGRRKGGLGSLVMAVYEGDRLRWVGNVGTGFDQQSLNDALDRLRGLEGTEPHFSADETRPRSELRSAHWVTPTLVARVEHRQLTDAGRLRAPSFQGFREDKDPEQCTYAQLVAETGS